MSNSSFVVQEFPDPVVDQSGRVYLTPLNAVESYENIYAYLDSVKVINNFRSAHSYPLHVMYMLVKRHSRATDASSLQARRIKRIPSIERKLKETTIKLSKMQDIGGCRSILTKMEDVNSTFARIQKGRHRHRLIKVNDYIKNPKESGYRSLHLVYKYESDKDASWNGMKIEVQIRTHLQHAWATAVEILGSLNKEGFKWSKGNIEWLDFFKWVSNYFAIIEKTPLMEGMPVGNELVERIKNHATEYRVIERLEAVSRAMKEIPSHQNKKHDYIFIVLNLEDENNPTVSYENFVQKDLDTYLQREQEMLKMPGKDVLIAATEDIEQIKTAYPNYFLDTEKFTVEIKKIIHLA